VRLRRRQCYAHSHCQQCACGKRAAAARRTLAGCVCAAGCRTPHARLTPAPNTRLACRVCRLQPESEVVPYRAGASRGAERRGEVTLR